MRHHRTRSRRRDACSRPVRFPIQREFERTPFELAAVLREVRRTFFHDALPLPDILFADSLSLACITHFPEGSGRLPIIVLNSILNHPETPELVVRYIIKHELLHLVVPAREIEGRRVSHPPEFFREEDRLAPERGMMWMWLYLNFSTILTLDRELQGTTVHRRRARHLWNRSRISLAEIHPLPDEEWPALEDLEIAATRPR